MREDIIESINKGTGMNLSINLQAAMVKKTQAQLIFSKVSKTDGKTWNWTDTDPSDHFLLLENVLHQTISDFKFEHSWGYQDSIL